MYYDMEGKEITCDEWIDGLSKPSRTLKRTELDGDVVVATVWLGLDHSMGGGPPLIFETMVFGLCEEYQERYTTKEEALAGHDRIVELVKEGKL